MNVKPECEKSNKRFSIVCIPYRRDLSIKHKFMTCDCITRACNQLLHVVIFHVHARHSRTRSHHDRSSVYARCNRKTYEAIRKCPILYDQSLKEYRDTDIKDRVLQTIADSLNIPGLKGTPNIN
jgi:hypothetical protein